MMGEYVFVVPVWTDRCVGGGAKNCRNKVHRVFGYTSNGLWRWPLCKKHYDLVALRDLPKGGDQMSDQGVTTPDPEPGTGEPENGEPATGPEKPTEPDQD